MEKIIIGNKQYKCHNLNKIFNLFEKNLRFNMALPENNNGTLYDEIILNNHVYASLKNSLDVNIQKYSEIFNISENYLKLFYENVYKYNKKSIQPYQENDICTLNNYLKKIGCNIELTHLPRVGFQGIILELMNNKKPTIIGYSLECDLYEDHSYVKNLKYGDPNISSIERSGHNAQSEIEIVIWLHNNNYIDATLCSLEDCELPILKCNIIKPSENIINKLLNLFGICILKNYYNKEEINNFTIEFNNVFDNYNNKIEILDKEKCSNDERIFHVQKYSSYIKNNFSDNELFDNVCKKYSGKKFDKKTLINKVVYEEGIVKNSGGGWHRDNHDMQFKTIMYLSDVDINNGNFQFITNSSKKYIGYPNARTKDGKEWEGNSRYEEKVINEILETKNECKIYNIVGEIGTIIIADTTYIHRGNIMQNVI